MSIVNYERKLFGEEEPNSFILPWGYILLRNVNSNGDLLLYRDIKEFRKSKVPVWVLCKVLIFRSEQNFFPVYACDLCDKMKHLETLTIDQDEGILNRSKCIHSQMADIVVLRSGEEWQDHWEVDLSDLTPADQVTDDNQDIAFQVSNANHIKYQTLRDDNRSHKDNRFLAVVQSPRFSKISILATVSRHMRKPVCSNCSVRVCKCFFLYKSLVEEEQERQNPGVPVSHHWDRHAEARQTSVETNENDQNNQPGHNKTPFLFPLDRDPDLNRMLEEQRNGELQYPERFVPEYDFSATCKHGNSFDPRERNLILISEDSNIYSTENEKKRRIPVYGRGTDGNCPCIQEPDTHGSFLQNMGNGKFVCYTFLLLTVLSFAAGNVLSAQWTARSQLLRSSFRTTLPLTLFIQAVVGFCSNLEFFKSDWKCEECGEGTHTPKYLVCDGKVLGIARRKEKKKNTELDRHEADQNHLCRGSQYKDRLFLSDRIERTQIMALLRKQISFQDYLAENCRSLNGQLIRNLLERVTSNFTEDIPFPYIKFLKDICKNTSISGLLQVRSDEPLEILKQFCQRILDLRSHQQKDNVLKLKGELPVIWHHIFEILKIERTKWLPGDLQQIFLKIIKIRRNIFRKSAKRYTSDYVRWPAGKGEHPLMFYPNWPIIYYPKKYIIGNTAEEDLCRKQFNNHKAFTAGFFSVGCYCFKNITHGFELLKKKESEHNLFRVLQCRNINHDRVEGIVYDNACNFNSYIMNREPRTYEYLRTLVDGCHWLNHNGCSEGFNSKNYKDSIPTLNSQGREQIHSVIEKLSPSFRNMNEFSYMTMLRVFFGINNLKKKNIL